MNVRPHSSLVTIVSVLSVAALGASGLPALAQPAPGPGAGDPGSEPAPAKRPFTALPYTPSLDLTAMDRSVDPCVDLYAYSCGGWMRKNPIPPDQARWSVYSKLYNDNQQYLWGLLEEASRTDRQRTPAVQKIGDFFGACVDEQAVERAGADPLKADLQAIGSLRSVAEIPRWLGSIHPSIDGAGMMFGMAVDQDPKSSEDVIVHAYAGGLGLPDRDYYLKDDSKSSETRTKYLAHIAQMLQLAGESREASEAGARTVMRIETELAKATLTRVERRDPYKTYHMMALKDLQRLTPSFRWSEYLTATGAPAVKKLNVTEPAFFTALGKQLGGGVSLEDWKTYLRWHLVRARAPYLSSPFVQASFDFYRAYLRGVKEMQPRWKRCVSWVDQDLGEALGQVFVEKTFPSEVKGQTLTMVHEIERAMEERIRELPWMSASTKKKALKKLSTVRNKIGYPDRWRDYSALEIRRGDFYGNVARASVFETKRQIAKIGKPVDRDEWGMTPPTVNAYYNAAMNDINFPAGVLLPPLYDPRLDDAPNYGNTGGTIGHELTHGFDDEGRQYDDRGNLRDWWTKSDAQEFEKRAACIVDQYAQYTVVDDIKINSKLTLGEDIADLGGTIIAWIAWKNAVRGKDLKPIDGLSPEQRFFVGYAQWTCENDREENMRLNALTNPHSPGIYRVNGVVVNMPEFGEAFHCKAGQPLVRTDPCRIW